MSTTTRRLRIGPADRGKRMSLRAFLDAEEDEGYLYELARGVLVVTLVPRAGHGMVVMRVGDLFRDHDRSHPGLIKYRASGSECRIRLPGMRSDRHPDYAVYLTPLPRPEDPWPVWIPAIVVEVISKGSIRRDYHEKREEYLRFGVLEYWILDPLKNAMLVLRRAGDVWEEVPVALDGIHETHLLPGLQARPADLLGVN